MVEAAAVNNSVQVLGPFEICPQQPRVETSEDDVGLVKRSSEFEPGDERKHARSRYRGVVCGFSRCAGESQAQNDKAIMCSEMIIMAQVFSLWPISFHTI